MHLVFLSSFVPVECPSSGFDIANRVIVEALTTLGVTVTSIGFLPAGARAAFPDRTTVLAQHDFTTAKADRQQKLLWLCDALLRGESYGIAKMHLVGEKVMRDTLARLAPFDGLILNSVQLPAAFLDVVRDYPSLYLAHNVEHRSASENAQAADTLTERILFRRDARLLRNFESKLCTTARHVFALSETDRLELAGDHPSSNVLPLVTRITPPPMTDGTAKTFDIGMIGTWTWQPNRIGLMWFLDEIVPHLPDRYSIAIAGDVGRPLETAHPGVRFLGRVPDAEAFVRSSRVVPMPSRAGTGVHLKAIETFELGVPSVATPLALRGIEQIPANCIVAEDAASFAVALKKRLDTKDLADEPRDGQRSFHARQLAGLHSALMQGLATLI